MIFKRNLILVILFTLSCLYSVPIAARYEQVTLGTVSWTQYTEWGASPFSDSYIQSKLEEKARQTYPGYSTYRVNIIQNEKAYESRDAPYTRTGDAFLDGYNSARIQSRYKHTATGQVTAEKWVDDPVPVYTAPVQETPRPQTKVNNTNRKQGFDGALGSAIENALDKVPSGSRIAFNRITVPMGISKSAVKDEILEALLDNNFKVVAKEYFDTIRDELEEQRSGEYNERTRVRDNNLSASGYLLDCKIADNVIRIYIINVSTGEYYSTSKVDYE